MDKKLITGLSFLAGAVVGGSGVYIWARKWINEQVNQEIEQFREDMKEDAKPLIEIKKEDVTDGDKAVNEIVSEGKKIFKSQTSRDYSSYFSGPSPDEIAKAARMSFNEHMADREVPEDEDEEEIDPDSIDETDDERQIREEGLVDIDGEVLAEYDPLKDIIKQTSERTYLIDEGSYGEVYSPEELVWCMKDGRLVDRADNSYYSDYYRIIGELPAGKFEDGDVIYIRNAALQFDYEIEFRNCDYDGYLDSLNP